MVWSTGRREYKNQLTKFGGKDDGDGSTEFHRETTGRRLEGQAVAQILHDVISIGPETDDDTRATKSKNPCRNSSLAAFNAAVAPDFVDGGIGADGIGDVVGTMSERCGGGSHDLEEGEHVLDLVVKVGGTSVGILKITRESILPPLQVDDIFVDTAQKRVLNPPEEDGSGHEGTFGLGANNRLVFGNAVVNIDI